MGRDGNAVAGGSDVTGFDDATLAQVTAANPAASTWLTANAGSGKTKVLTDRVTRLLLDGVDPEGVLCLTYTKAAAAEMQNRLFKRLGAWAMMEDVELREELAKTGVTGTPDLDRARTLFARAIETPGGIKIQTIHAFCAMLLRRFPLEAGVSPGFRELEDADADMLREDVVDRLARRGAPEIAAVARYLSTDDLSELSKAVVDAAPSFTTKLDRPALADCMGIPPSLTAEALLSDLVGNDGPATLASLKTALAGGSSSDEKTLKKIASVDPANMTADDHAILESVFLTSSGAGSPFTAKVGSFPTKATRAAMMGPALDALDAMMERAERLREPRLAVAALEKADALRRFAQSFLPAYERAKAERGAVDFADLIARANRLFSDPSVAEWVLWRIDGDIDHILVDEAQDTSPGQWEVIEKLAAEMTAGKGVREDVRRTIFVVGDLKQSIYSFQGAEPAGSFIPSVPRPLFSKRSMPPSRAPVPRASVTAWTTPPSRPACRAGSTSGPSRSQARRTTKRNGSTLSTGCSKARRPHASPTASRAKCAAGSKQRLFRRKTANFGR